ncbi:MAG TPA: uroporphyrinogen-III C-methyltransferase [Paludibacter sp.]|nr:uroporphyrinogen-III C-methyltransferase [Paludibacter sp.]
MKAIKVHSGLAQAQLDKVFALYPQLYGFGVASLGNDAVAARLIGSPDIALVHAPDLPYPLPETLQVAALLDGGEGIEAEAGNPLAGLVAVLAAAGNVESLGIFHAHDLRRAYGHVTLVGFGPGSPDLLTIGGEKAIAQADVIFYDNLLDKDFLKKYDAELVDVGKRKGKHSAEQAKINRLLLDEARKGKKVVRLKGGDPMVFAHGGEEVEFLKTNLVEVSVIPGITTALALASLAQVPLTHRGISSSVAFVSGHAAQIQLPNADTVVCYMAGYNIPGIAAKAIEDGRDPQTPVLLVSDVSNPGQQEFFYTLESLSLETKILPTPIIGVVGEVVNLRLKPEKELAKPLYLYTGNAYSGKRIDGKIINQPLFEVAELEDKTEVFAEINQLHTYEWIVFTSRYAVKYFFEALREQGKDTRSLAHLKIASIGAITTKSLNLRGIFPDLEPAGNSTSGIVESFGRLKGQKGRILIPRSGKAMPHIPDGLVAQGWEVKPLVAYRNRMPVNLKPLDLTRFAGIIFASPSCVDNFVELYGSLPADKELIALGRTTGMQLDKFRSLPQQSDTMFGV